MHAQQKPHFDVPQRRDAVGDSTYTADPCREPTYLRAHVYWLYALWNPHLLARRVYALPQGQPTLNSTMGDRTRGIRKHKT